MRARWGERVAPIRLRVREGQGVSLVDSAGNGAGRDVGGDRAQVGEVGNRVSEGAGPGRCGEHQVSIERGMDRPDRAREHRPAP